MRNQLEEWINGNSHYVVCEISNIVYYNNWEDRKYTSVNFCTCVEL